MDLWAATRDETEGGTEDEWSLGRVYLKFLCQSPFQREQEEREKYQQRGKKEPILEVLKDSRLVSILYRSVTDKMNTDDGQTEGWMDR